MFPNPSRGEVRVGFDLPSRDRAELGVFDISGHLVRPLADESSSLGGHELSWDGSGSAGARLPAGVYFVRLVSGSRAVTEKVLRTN